MSPTKQSDSVIRGARIDAASVSDAFGRIYTPRELAELWQLSENSIRRMFQDQAGVFTLGNPNPRGRRSYCTLRIPEAVALRVWRQRGGGGAA